MDILQSRSGYTFLGWATSSSATSANGSYDPGDEFTMTENVTLWAVWKLSSPTYGLLIASPAATGAQHDWWFGVTSYGYVSDYAWAYSGGPKPAYHWYSFSNWGDVVGNWGGIRMYYSFQVGDTITFTYHFEASDVWELGTLVGFDAGAYTWDQVNPDVTATVTMECTKAGEYMDFLLGMYNGGNVYAGGNRTYGVWNMEYFN